MRAIETSCATGTADRLRLRWRLLFAILINAAAWRAIIWGVSKCL